MNGLDYAIIVLIAIGAFYGLTRGAVRMITSAVSLIAAIYVASVYYARAGAIAESQLGTRPTVGAVIGFIAVFALVFIAVEIVGNAIVRVLEIVHLGALDRLVGGLLGAAIAASIAGFAVMLLSAMLPANAAILRDSQVVPMLFAYNEAVVAFIPADARQTYDHKRDELMRYWAQNAMKGGSYKPSPAASPSPSAK
jgi:membrane protein required for colicin V production